MFFFVLPMALGFWLARGVALVILYARHFKQVRHIAVTLACHSCLSCAVRGFGPVLRARSKALGIP